MTTSRPRQSLLSLFDPLLDPSHDQRTLSPDSDKENTLSLLPPQPRPPPVHIPKRRLVDVGDITIEEDNTDLGHFLDDEELEDQLHSTVHDDENETLTFRDMAKAATPKWSASRKTRTTPPSQLRTPLAEIHPSEDVTPLARKRPPKFPFAISASPSAAPTQDILHSLPIFNIIPGSPTLPTLPAIIEPPKFDVPGALAPRQEQENDLRQSMSSINLAASTTSLITETAIPAFTPSSSSSTSPSAPSGSPIMQTGLRPPKPTHDANRHSIDLHASFQLHLGGSEPVFDLLNDKVSFFNSQNGHDSFLSNLEDEASFEPESPPTSVERGLAPPHDASRPSLDFDKVPTSPSLLIEPDISVQHPRLSLDSMTEPRHRSPSPSSTDANSGPDSVPQTPNADTFKLADNAYNTPSSLGVGSGAPRAPVAALKIVKRGKVLAPSRPRASLAPRNDVSTSTTYTIRDPSPKRLIASRPPVAATEARASARSTMRPVSAIAPRSSTTAGVPLAPVRDGPRRILITDAKTGGARGTEASKASALSGSTGIGPRRVIPTSKVEQAKVTGTGAMKEGSRGPGLRPPTKYATLGASSIPKPAAKSNGSGIPGPISGTLRRGLGGNKRGV